MKNTVVVCIVWFSMSCLVHAGELPKLKGLWTTGGCCHDYAKNAPFLTGKIGQYANVGFKIVGEPDALKLFKDKDYAKNYDVVVYDLCYAGAQDKELIDNITRTIHEGKPTVIVHCSLHTFQPAAGNAWREAMGLTSNSHDGFRALRTKKVAEHPIVKFWPEDWKTQGDELYRNIKFWPTSRALLTAYSVESQKDHVVAWTNRYGKGRVFATTLGHNMLTIGQPEYPRLLANGLLWVCGKLDAQGNPVAGYEGTGKP
jgi:uncharacterized protein